MSTKANRKRLSKEVRALIRASSKSTSELAEELGCSSPTIRRWKLSDDVEDHSSRPQRLQTSLTSGQEHDIIALWTTRPQPLDQSLVEVRSHVAPDCSRSALYRCLKRNCIGDYGAAKNVPKRDGSPEHCPLPTKSLAAYAISGVDPASVGPSNNIELNPSPVDTLSFTRTKPLAPVPSPINSQAIKSGLPAPCKSENTADIPASSTPPVYPACTLEKSIDFVTLNHIGPEHTDTLFRFLEGNGFKVKYDGFVPGKTWSFGRMRCFLVEGRTQILVYYQSFAYNKTLWVRVMRPTRPLLTILDEFFDGLGIAPRVRELELSFDFHSQDPGLMRQFVISHLYLRHQRSPSGFQESTYYPTDLSESDNGMRCYIKKIRKYAH